MVLMESSSLTRQLVSGIIGSKDLSRTEACFKSNLSCCSDELWYVYLSSLLVMDCTVLLKMKHIPYTYIIFAIICFIISGVFWSESLIYILDLVGVTIGSTIGWLVVVAVNLLHFTKGFFHPDRVEENPNHNAFYIDYLYIKLIGFLTVGTSIYATKALSEYKHDKEHDA